MDNFIRKYADIPNPITKFFNKIDSALLCEDDHREEIEWLEAMKKVPLYVKRISIYSNNEEQLENLTDSNMHNIPINKLDLELNSIKISSKTIKNLKEIYPNSITLRDDSKTKGETTNQAMFENFTKLLSKLDRISLEMDFQKNYNKIILEFRDVILKVVESKEECTYIRAKSVEIRCEDEELYWIK